MMMIGDGDGDGDGDGGDDVARDDDGRQSEATRRCFKGKSIFTKCERLKSIIVLDSNRDQSSNISQSIQ